MGIAPARVIDSDNLVIWHRMNDKRRRVHTVRAKFSVGQHVRIMKEQMKFAKGYEQNFSTKIFRISKVIKRAPRPVYEQVGLKKTPNDGQFYQKELTAVRVTQSTVYKITSNIGQEGETRHYGISSPLERILEGL